MLFRSIEVEWEDLKVGKSYNADICIAAGERKGIFSDISRACEDMDVNISGALSACSRHCYLEMQHGKGLQ